MGYERNHFGPYLGSYTTANDVAEVLALIESKKQLDVSKRDAVYPRKDDIMARTISNGLGFKIERVASTDQEFEALGNKEKKIIGFTGGYILGVDENGIQARIPTETAIDLKNRVHHVAEVGTSLVIPANDLPNAVGMRPKRCFYKILIAATELNLFRLAGQEVGGHKINFDTVTANVQNREEMRGIMNWLTSPPLAWRMIERPSSQLAALSSGTTIDENNYRSHDKFFYELPPTSLSPAAQYLLECCANGYAVSDHKFEKNTAHISLNFDDNMIRFLDVVAQSGAYFAQNADVGLEDIRRRLYIPESESTATVLKFRSSPPILNRFSANGHGGAIAAAAPG